MVVTPPRPEEISSPTIRSRPEEIEAHIAVGDEQSPEGCRQGLEGEHAHVVVGGGGQRPANGRHEGLEVGVKYLYGCGRGGKGINSRSSAGIIPVIIFVMREKSGRGELQVIKQPGEGSLQWEDPTYS